MKTILQSESDLKDFLKSEVEKQKGICHPVRAGLPERLIVRWVLSKRLHPNPEDEFCMPQIGPNMSIITSYVDRFLFRHSHGESMIEEPLFVQKINTGGYMVLNGHHRWAASMRIGIRWIPVIIVNTAGADDIRKMLEESKNDRRVTFDLDEVVFCHNDYPYIERSFSLMRFGIQKAKLRLGIPALFSFFSTHGYDIWVYSSNYYSIDDVDRFFKHYSVWVNGIITGKNAPAGRGWAGTKKTDGSAGIEHMAASKYKETIHIDGDTMLVTYPDKKDFLEIPLGGFRENWSRDVINEAEKLIGSGREDGQKI